MATTAGLTFSEREAYKKGIADFVNRMSAETRKHSGYAAHEDMLMAVAHFEIDPAEFYEGDSYQQDIIRAQAEVYKLTGEVTI